MITAFLFSCSTDKGDDKQTVDEDIQAISALNVQDTSSLWVGGFEASNTLFAYPDPNLNSLHMLDNMANIDKLKRQQKALWPEFSWKTDENDESTRLYTRFAPDISRIGYDEYGRVFSYICPQNGFYSPTFGVVNLEITVTGTRGWVNESTREFAADLSVVGKLWFSEGLENKEEFKLLKELFEREKLPFPLSKKQALVIKTNSPGNPNEPIFSLRKGTSQGFKIPEFAKHEKEAWNVGHLNVEIGEPLAVGHEMVDEFNQLYLKFFNLTSGNFLQKGHVLSWNIWFAEPENVNQKEWSEHAIRWRESIHTGHAYKDGRIASPTGVQTIPRYFDGREFIPEGLKELEKKELKAFLKKYL